jgi:Mn-containing catalase
MVGLIEEGSEVLQEDLDPVPHDIAITGAACRVEHYEMSAYQTAITLAKQLGYTEAVRLLSESLKEEQNAEQKMRTLSSRLMKSVGNGTAERREPAAAGGRSRR